MIKEGVAAKRRQLPRLSNTSCSRRRITESEAALDLNLERTKAKRDILETVKSHYEVLEEITALNHSLENEEDAEIPKAIHTENQSGWKMPMSRERITQWQQQFRELADKRKREQAPNSKLLLQHTSCRALDRLSGLQRNGTT